MGPIKPDRRRRNEFFMAPASYRFGEDLKDTRLKRANKTVFFPLAFPEIAGEAKYPSGSKSFPHSLMSSATLARTLNSTFLNGLDWHRKRRFHGGNFAAVPVRVVINSHD